MASVPDIKVEVPTGDSMEMDATSLASEEEEDTYEDTGELEMPKQVRNAWLARMPRSAHTQWASLDENEEVQLGTIRRYANGKVKLILKDVPQNERIPKEFNLKVNDSKVKNTFTFSEKDLPGFKGRRRQFNRPQQDKKDGYHAGGVDKSRRYQPFFRRSLPKQTSLVARINQEVICEAVETDESFRLLKEQMYASTSSKPGVSFLEGDVRRYAGMIAGSNDLRNGVGVGRFEGFVRSGVASNKPKPQENKAARIPRADLIDMLYEAFSKYQYWSLKALRAKTNQPEAYLRETLGMIAELVKTGPFAANYKLREEAKPSNMDMAEADLKGEVAPQEDEETSAGDDDEDKIDEEDDDDIAMEDAMASNTT